MTVIFDTEQEILWKSCTTIKKNILKSYSQFLDAKKVSAKNSSEIAQKEAAKITAALKPKRVILIDHTPHPSAFISELYRLSKNSKLPELIVHVYGDFLLYTKAWNSLEKILKHFKIKFICASDSQVRLLEKVLEPAKVIFKCPFPVDTSEFYIDKGTRKEFRRIWKHTDSDHLFIYSGRLSRQKSILETVAIFSDLYLKTRTNCFLYLAGEFDDLGIPYLGRHDSINQYCTETLLFIESLPEIVRSRIRFFGQLSSQDLNTVYNGCDSFISFSVHNDEDFGMSPAEAAVCGLPLTITRWGGYSSFQVRPETCLFIPTTITSNKVGFNSKLALKSMFYRLANPLSDRHRSQISNDYKNYFSVDAVSEKLASLIYKPGAAFSKFKEPFKQLSNQSSGFVPQFKTESGKYSNIYQELYSSYRT